MRRRDGKTCLHYAARNGHLDCIQYLLLEEKLEVDPASGDGTTPLHMACFGGQLQVVQYLINQAGANVLAKNDWGCSTAHWTAMSNSNSSSSNDDVVAICQLLQSKGVSFTEHQKQGHTALHKAAQRRNRHVIEWMANHALTTSTERALAGGTDNGGHSASEIWLSVGGDTPFAQRMKDEWGW